MSGKFERIAIVTGATSGIGEATARKFVSSGFGVVGNGRNKEKLEAMEKEIGTAFRYVAGDAADDSVLEHLFEAATRHFGRPADIVIVNAGRGLSGSVTEADLTQFNEVMRTNVAGVVSLLQKSAKKMIQMKQRHYPDSPADIVIIGSVAGHHISPFSAVYGSTKFAVSALAEGLRREIASKGIRVSLVEPGVVLSGFQDVAGYSDELVKGFKDKFGPLLVGDDIAEAIYYIVTRPSHVHISHIMVRPTRQDYP